MRRLLYFAEQYHKHFSKLGYFTGNQDYNTEFYPFNEYGNPGVMIDRDRDLDRLENHQRDGKDFEEFKQFMRRKLRKRMLMKSKKEVLSPTPFYEGMYGGWGTEGLLNPQSAYYSGWIGENPYPITNPFNNTYQAMASTFPNEKIIIRAMIFKDFFKKPHND